MDAVFNRCLFWSDGYQHYNSHLHDFYDGLGGHHVASVNNRSLDLERLSTFRISRFLRDPRDLIVSAYFYHRRGAEEWVTLQAPTAEDWYFANARAPEALQKDGISLSEYLQSIPEEEGLLAEMEVRAPHFESMAQWPREHPDILTFRYEDILGHEQQVFGSIFEHYGFSPLQRRLGDFFVRRYSLKKQKRRGDAHVRNPSSGQWRKHFTPRVRRAFDEKYAGLIRDLGYPAD